MSDEKRCECCQRYWYYDDLVSGLCPNCLDFLATKNQIDIEQDQKIKELETKLAKFEDFMEEQGFEDLESFKWALNFMKDLNKVGAKTLLENQALEDRWQKLKEFIVKEQGYASMYQEERIETLDDVKDKMEKLEDEFGIEKPTPCLPNGVKWQCGKVGGEK